MASSSWAPRYGGVSADGVVWERKDMMADDPILTDFLVDQARVSEHVTASSCCSSRRASLRDRSTLTHSRPSFPPVFLKGPTGRTLGQTPATACWVSPPNRPQIPFRRHSHVTGTSRGSRDTASTPCFAQRAVQLLGDMERGAVRDREKACPRLRITRDRNRRTCFQKRSVLQSQNPRCKLADAVDRDSGTLIRVDTGQSRDDFEVKLASDLSNQTRHRQ